jgi:hypothetical protein
VFSSQLLDLSATPHLIDAVVNVLDEDLAEHPGNCIPSSLESVSRSNLLGGPNRSVLTVLGS